MKIAIIAALDKANGIGRNNQLLCHLPADLKRFKQLTTGHCILMGRKTFESLPNGALPNRKNIVLTHNTSYKAEGCTVVYSISEALKQNEDQEKIFIIGGEQIYQLFIQYADILYITKIHHTFEADAFFPKFDMNQWQIGSKTDFKSDEKNKFDYSFIDFYIKR